MKLAKKLLIIMPLLASSETFGIGAGGYEEFGGGWFWVFFLIACQWLLPVVSFIAILAMPRRAKLFHRLIWATTSLVAPHVLYFLNISLSYVLIKKIKLLAYLSFSLHFVIVFLPLILLYLFMKQHGLPAFPSPSLGMRVGKL
ncbi:MAG: hypothetical protein CTY16_03990 [Methylobacter sp.]|nr:MAG: hypothetical protein CTY16_03990 [Methylobacter sp.]